MGIKSFREIIDEHIIADFKPQELLSFCHTTTTGYASGIVTAKKATPQPCEVYGENLLYFFYGKAVYLVESKQQSIYTDNPPVTFLFDSNILSKHLIKRILPFDSGGFDRFGMKAGFIKERFTYEKPDLDKIMAFVNFIYTNHDNYLKENVKTENLEKYVEFCLDVEELLSAYKKAEGGINETGPQIYSFELQISDEIEFKPTHIILPYEYNSSRFWNVSFKNDYPDVEIIFYGKDEWLAKPGKALIASEYQRLMRNKVDEIMQNIINERTPKN